MLLGAGAHVFSRLQSAAFRQLAQPARGGYMLRFFGPRTECADRPRRGLRRESRRSWTRTGALFVPFGGEKSCCALAPRVNSSRNRHADRAEVLEKALVRRGSGPRPAACLAARGSTAAGFCVRAGRDFLPRLGGCHRAADGALVRMVARRRHAAGHRLGRRDHGAVRHDDPAKRGHAGGAAPHRLAGRARSDRRRRGGSPARSTKPARRSCPGMW